MVPELAGTIRVSGAPAFHGLARLYFSSSVRSRSSASLAETRIPSDRLDYPIVRSKRCERHVGLVRRAEAQEIECDHPAPGGRDARSYLFIDAAIVWKSVQHHECRSGTSVVTDVYSMTSARYVTLLVQLCAGCGAHDTSPANLGR
jgi:hypothetical protein